MQICWKNGDRRAAPQGRVEDPLKNLLPCCYRCGWTWFSLIRVVQHSMRFDQDLCDP